MIIRYKASSYIVALILLTYNIQIKSGLFVFFQYGDSELLYKVTMEEMMNKYYGFDVYNPPDRVDLRVNTSIYVMWSNELDHAMSFQELFVIKTFGGNVIFYIRTMMYLFSNEWNFHTEWKCRCCSKQQVMFVDHNDCYTFISSSSTHEWYIH